MSKHGPIGQIQTVPKGNEKIDEVPRSVACSASRVRAPRNGDVQLQKIHSFRNIDTTVKVVLRAKEVSGSPEFKERSSGINE